MTREDDGSNQRIAREEYREVRAAGGFRNPGGRKRWKRWLHKLQRRAMKRKAEDKGD